MKKLWSVKVNDWGWSSPKTIYADSRAAAEQIASRYPASDPVQYAGNFSAARADRLLAAASEGDCGSRTSSKGGG